MSLEDTIEPGVPPPPREWDLPFRPQPAQLHGLQLHGLQLHGLQLHEQQQQQLAALIAFAFAFDFGSVCFFCVFIFSSFSSFLCFLFICATTSTSEALAPSLELTLHTFFHYT